MGPKGECGELGPGRIWGACPGQGAGGPGARWGLKEGKSPSQEPAHGPLNGTNVPQQRCQHLSCDTGGQQGWLRTVQGSLSRTKHCSKDSPFPHWGRAVPHVPVSQEPFRGGDSSPQSPAPRTSPRLLPEGKQSGSCLVLSPGKAPTLCLLVLHLWMKRTDTPVPWPLFPSVCSGPGSVPGWSQEPTDILFSCLRLGKVP